MNMRLGCRIFSLILLMVTSLSVAAQWKGFSLGPYLEIARPTAGFEERNGNGIGGGMSADINLPGKFGLTGSAGYLRFSGANSQTSGGKTPALGAFPLRAGIKYKMLPLLYVKLESGSAVMTRNRGSATIISPGIGVRFLGLDIQGKFEAWLTDETSSFWGLKASYQF